MDKIKNILINAFIVIGVIGLLFTNFEESTTIEEKIRIGVSDDTSGFVINYMKNNDYVSSADVETLLEPYAINDC